MYMSSKDIAKQIRKDLKEEFGKTAKFSVRKHDFSGGRSITIAIKKADSQYFKTLKEFEEEHETYKLYHPESYKGLFNRFIRGDKIALKEEFVKKVEEIGNRLNWDNSEPEIDYFDVNYYLDITGSEIEVIC